jgi:hypothetical protein
MHTEMRRALHAIVEGFEPFEVSLGSSKVPTVRGRVVRLLKDYFEVEILPGQKGTSAGVIKRDYSNEPYPKGKPVSKTRERNWNIGQNEPLALDSEDLKRIRMRSGRHPVSGPVLSPEELEKVKAKFPQYA